MLIAPPDRDFHLFHHHRFFFFTYDSQLSRPSGTRVLTRYAQLALQNNTLPAACCMEATPEHALVTNVSHDTIEPNLDTSHPNGIISLQMEDEPFADIDVEAIDMLETELPVVLDGQVPLGEVITRTVQAVYAELSELAETYVPPWNHRTLSLII